jgi:lipopolysaccharide/colanic/teichoic acid biosynthesis glycosyltransferase
MSAVPRGMRLKRVLDVVGALVALTVLSPLLLLIAALIKLETGGPVLAATCRKYYGREVTVFQFPAKNCQDSTRDFLIHSGANQLPSLLSILSGDLSFIGPSFPTSLVIPPSYLEAFYSSPLRPGLLGPKVPSGGGNFGSNKLDADYFYISCWSFWLDVNVLYSHAFPKQPTFTDRQAY